MHIIFQFLKGSFKSWIVEVLLVAEAQIFWMSVK